MQPSAMHVEKVLDDLIQRLSKSQTNSEVRAALIEARRLRNVTMRWAAIPPPPDARREMLSRVMDLVQKAGPQAVGSLRPPAMSIAPEEEAKPSSPAPGRVEQRASPASGGIKFRDAETTRSPSSRPPHRDRAGELLDDVAPRRPVTGPQRPGSIPDRSVPPPPPSQSPSIHQRSTTPAPAPAPDPRRNISAPPPAASTADRFKQRPTSTLGYDGGDPQRGGLRIPSPPKASPTREPSPPPSPSPRAEAARPAPSPKPAPSARPSPARPQPSSPPPSAAPEPDPEFALPPPPAAALSAAKAFSANARTHTLAGIPEANEAASLVELALRKSSTAPQRSDTPSSPAEPGPSGAPKPRVATLAPGEAPPPVAARSPSAPPPLRKPSRAGTLMMGGIAVAETLEGLTKKPVPPSTPPDEADEPPRGRPSLRAQQSVTPVPASVRASGDGVEGFSSTVSSPSIPAVRPSRPATGATQMMGTPPPAPATLTPRSMPASEKPLRTIVSPGVTIVRPDASPWQPHPSAAGVTLKLLYRDPRSGVYTALVRLAPGSSLPRRRHLSSEEALLVSGIAMVGPHEMRPGEYCRAESETVHDPITTATGCTFFLCGSEHDEFLEGP